MGLYSEGLIIRRIFASGIWGAYFREGLFLGELIIGILRYLEIVTSLSMFVRFTRLKRDPASSTEMTIHEKLRFIRVTIGHLQSFALVIYLPVTIHTLARHKSP